VEDSLATLAGEYRTKHGYVPTREALARLAQQATLSDRPDNEQRSLAESRQAWAQEAAKVVGCRPDQVGEHLAQEVARAGPALKPLRRGKAYQQAQKTVDALVDAGATWSEWDLRRAATAQLREAGFRVDRAGVDKVVDLTLGLAEVLAVAPPLAEETPESLRRSDGSSVFERRGEARYTSRRVVDAEAALVALAQLRGLSPAEIARRKTTLFAEVEDDALVAGMDGAQRHISEMSQRLAVHHQVAAAAQDDVVQARVALATHRPEDGPRLRLVRQQSQAEEVATERLAVINQTLGRRGLRRTSQAERAQLQAEWVTLMRQHPYAGESPTARQVRMARATDQALRADRSSREQLVAQHGQAKSALAQAGGKVRVLEAEITEQSQAAKALAAELQVRQAATGRVDLTGRLEGLGVDQAAAITRLADPSRPLDALIGPAGSGKTTALERLVGAFGEAGRSVQVLAPTAVGAQALGEAVNSPYSTMHSALGAWRKGLRLPGPGDLVLMDEASMGTTSMILETAQLAIGRGALVRLIGDPRQLKAVGAGGGLALVAEAVGAPELSELRRFNHAWEAQATLGLRRGDTDAIDAYIGHDRVVGALDAVAIDDVFRDWWNSPAGRAHTIMVASDNATVRQLNLLARQARLAAREITPSSTIELHDATMAGPGDLVTTRANDITTATRRNPGQGAHVRNHDRWVIDEVGQDGSLLVSHLDRGEQVRLSSAYAAQHVELAYADTGHAVQGRTVDRAEVLVRPSDTRWYLYVAMSRAREHTTAHVVVDQVEEEPAGYHPVRTPREVLTAVLAREEPVSATDWTRVTRGAQADPALMADRYRTGASEELRQRLLRTLAGHWGAGVGSALSGPEGWRVMAAAEAVEAGGLDAGAVVSEAASGDVDTLVTALNWAGFSGADPLGQARMRPLAAGVLPAPGGQVAPDVAVWQTSLTNRLEAWRDALAARLTSGDPPPQWAAPLGPVPENLEDRPRWAAKVSQVALFRATHRVEDNRLYAAKRGERPRIRAVGGACHDTPQCNNNRSR